MRIGTLALIICSSCMPEFKFSPVPKINHMHVLEHNKFSWDLQEDNSLIIQAASKPRLKDLKARIILISSPEHEVLENIPKKSSITLSLKLFEAQGLLKLTPKKSQLVVGTYYGLYAREEIGQIWELKHIFYIKYPAPVLLSHDVGEKVSKNRRKFSFKFDQAISILNDQAVIFKSQSARAPEVSSLKILSDKKTLIISREQDVEFTEHETYYIIFDNLVNLDNQKIILEPIEFVASQIEENLKITKPLKLDISSDSAEIQWHLNNNYDAELYFGEDLSGFYNCLGQNCPHQLRVIPLGGQDSSKSFLGTHFFTGLKPKTAYYYILRAEDNQGQILISSGVFKTRASVDLRFSEIFINPQKKPEHKAEFIELFYAGLKPQKFDNLRLIFYGSEDSSEECLLATLENILYVRPQEYIIIVGHDFDEISAKLPKDTQIIRLKKKSLCGGLANRSPRFIKLSDEIGMVDHYGAHLWQAPEGLSVRRRDVRGLDDLDNYCYSDTAGGPTPGGPN